MTKTFERFWVSWLNSSRWRQFAKYGPGSKFFRSDAYQKLDLTRRHLATRFQIRREPAMFQEVKTFCMFVGHAKSGSTLLGSLLDAHSDIILADEADALKYVAHGFSREQIYHILLKTSRREAMKGRVTARRLTPYSCQVPGQWQGRYRTLQVIGDSKAGPTTRRLSQQPHLWPALRQTMSGVEVKLFHVIRNPFDPISLMMIRGQRTFDNAIDHYFDYCRTLAALRAHTNSRTLLPVRYEDIVGQPATQLAHICEFLGVTASSDYLTACAQILHPSPAQDRHQIPWTADWIAVVERKIEQFDFLAGYSFES